MTGQETVQSALLCKRWFGHIFLFLFFITGSSYKQDMATGQSTKQDKYRCKMKQLQVWHDAKLHSKGKRLA